MCVLINILNGLVNSAVALRLISSAQDWILVQFAVWKAFGVIVQ